MVAKNATKRRRFGSVRKLPSGRHQARYVGPDLNRYTAPRTFQSQDDAFAWLRSEEKLVEFDEWTSPDKRARTAEVEAVADVLTVGAFAASWLAERNLRPTTRNLYAGHVRNRFYELADVLVVALTPAVVRQWWSQLQVEHPTTGTRNAQSYALLRTMCATAVEDHLLPANPCTLRTAGRAPKRAEIDLLTVAELDAVAKVIAPHYAVAVLVAGWCGLRYGELTELRRRDVAADGSVIKVRRAVSYVDGEFHVGLPKTDTGIRDVIVPPHLRPVLAEHIRTFSAPGGDGLMFCTRNHTRVWHSTFRAAFQRALKRAGIEKRVTVNHLRHLAGTLTARTSATTAEIMARLGHVSPGAALGYQHATRDRAEAVAEELSKLAGGEP